MTLLEVSKSHLLKCQKTTTCENLGIGLANEGKRVLLVDTDVFCQVKIPGWGCGQNLGPNKATGGSACTPMSSEWRQSNFI